MTETPVMTRIAELGEKVKALEHFTVNGYADMRRERDTLRTALEVIRSSAVHAVERSESEACDCARLAAEVLDG